MRKLATEQIFLAVSASKLFAPFVRSYVVSCISLMLEIYTKSLSISICGECVRLVKKL